MPISEKTIKLTIDIDGKENVDQAIEKANQLKSLLQEVIKLIDSLSTKN